MSTGNEQDSGGPNRGLPRGLLLALAAAVLLFAGGVVGWAVRGDGDAPSPVTMTEVAESDQAGTAPGEDRTDSPAGDEQPQAGGEVTRELLAASDSPDGLDELIDSRTLAMAR